MTLLTHLYQQVGVFFAEKNKATNSVAGGARDNTSDQPKRLVESDVRKDA
jgi:hypothetical protein